MNHPEISVLMSVFNGSKWLKQSIDSVLNQKGIDFELVVINDGSTDKTSKILESYNNEKLNIFNRNNNGLTKSLNYGLKKCRGRFIARIDADDICMPNRLRQQLQFLNKHDDITLVGSNAILIGGSDEYLGSSVYPSLNNDLVNRLINFQSIFPHSSIFFQKDDILNLGGYNENYYRAQDYELYLRLSKNHKIATIQKSLISLRLNIFGPTLSDEKQFIYALAALINYYRKEKNLIDYSQSKIKVWNNFLNLIEDWLEDSNISNIYHYKRHLRLFKIFIKQKNYGKAFKILCAELIRHPLLLNKKLIKEIPNSFKEFLH